MSHSGEPARKLRVSYRMGDVWALQLSVKEALLTEMDAFVASVTQGIAPVTSGLNGLRVVEMLERTELSLNRRGHPVEIAPAQPKPALILHNGDGVAAGGSVAPALALPYSDRLHLGHDQVS